MAKSKFYKKSQSLDSKNKFFALTTKNNFENILKIKNIFSKLPSGKIIEISNVVNNSGVKDKPKLNITTKGPFRKQVIIPMSKVNARTIALQANVIIEWYWLKQSHKPLSSTIQIISKIIEISYYIVKTNPSITSDVMEKTIKETHIFNDIVLVSYPCIIKASPKSDIAVI